jgi:hypothetical protein
MENFKGTEENLTVTPAIGFRNEILYYNVSIEGQNIASFHANEYNGTTLEKAKANAVLFSKAPEILEKLNEMVEAIENETIIIKENIDNDGYENFGGRFYQEAKSLIKSATELS